MKLLVFIYFGLAVCPCFECRNLQQPSPSAAATATTEHENSVKKKHRSFCGVKDIEETSASNTRQKRYILRGTRWNKRVITWRLINISPYLGVADTLFRIEIAFKTWERHTSLVFKRKSFGKADIMIKFADQRHLVTDYAYCSVQFDGPGGNIGHAFYPFPGEEYGGDIHLDNRERFTSNQGENGINFAATILHEIGHSLGLMHTNQHNSVMNPDYILKVKRVLVDLEYDDISAIQSLYGAPYGKKATVRRTTLATTAKNVQTSTLRPIKDETSYTRVGVYSTLQPSSTTMTHGKNFKQTKQETKNTIMSSPSLQSQTVLPSTKTILQTTATPTTMKSTTTTTISYTKMKIAKPRIKVPASCPTALDSIFVSKRNSKTYMIQGDMAFPFGGNLEKTGIRMPVKKRFRFKTLDASYIRKKSKELVVFSGQKYAIFKNEIWLKKLGSIYDLGFPFYVKKVDAAVIFGRYKRTYFFTGKLYWRFNEKSQKMDRGYPKKISTVWKGVPSNVDSAVTWRNRVTYFFKGPLYYRINARTASVERGYPKSINSVWTKC